MKINTFKKIIIGIVILIILCIYFVFLYLDSKPVRDYWALSVRLKYLGVVICFINSLFIGKNGVSFRDRNLLSAGMFFTCLADLNLLILDNFGIGVAFFCIVQTIYIHRYNPGFRITRGKAFGAITYICIVLSIVYGANLAGDFNIIYIAVPLYAVLLPASVWNALATFKRKDYPEINCFLVSTGMIMFLLCDLNVAVFNIFSGKGINVFGKTPIEDISVYLIWLFYMPSQLLLSLSGYEFK